MRTQHIIMATVVLAMAAGGLTGCALPERNGAVKSGLPSETVVMNSEPTNGQSTTATSRSGQTSKQAVAVAQPATAGSLPQV